MHDTLRRALRGLLGDGRGLSRGSGSYGRLHEGSSLLGSGRGGGSSHRCNCVGHVGNNGLHDSGKLSSGLTPLAADVALHGLRDGSYRDLSRRLNGGRCGRIVRGGGNRPPRGTRVLNNSIAWTKEASINKLYN